MAHKILMITTSHAEMAAGKRTGVWLEEFTTPYELFRDAGAEITVASPAGGDVPIEPRSLPAIDTSAHGDAIQALLGTRRVDGVNLEAFDAVFLPGGHGPMYDLANDAATAQVISTLFDSGRVVGAVCHGPAALVNVTLADGNPLVQGRRLTSFLDSEEAQAGFTEHMPFLLQSRLTELGADFAAGEPWTENVVTDGCLVTGQNPLSSRATAEAMLRALG